MVEYVMATDISVDLDGVNLGCLQTADIAIDRETKDVTCQAAGIWKEQIAGQMSWTVGLSGIGRSFTEAELADNVTVEDMYNKLKSGKTVTFSYKEQVVGNIGFLYVGQAYIKGLKFGRPENNEAKWSADLVGNGPLTQTRL